MRFQTKIQEADGSLAEAELDAVDAQSLHDLLHRQGRLLVRVEPLGLLAEQQALDYALTPRRLLLLTQALQEALDAGVPLLSVFQAIGAQEKDPKLAAIVEGLETRVAAGQVLSDALTTYPHAFPAVYCALVKAGEQSGSLPRVLQALAGFLEWRLEIAGVVRQAMVYPLVVAAAGYGMVLFLLSFVIPRLGSVIEKIGKELPPASRVLIGSSKFVAEHILAIVVLSLLVAALAYLWSRTQVAREVVARCLAVLPVARGVLAALAVAQFCRTFAVMLQAGLTMPHALELSAAAVASPRFRGQVGAVRERILGGARLTEAVEELELLPPVASSMIKVGEEAGRLPVTFERLGRLYDREVKESVKRALGLMEPIVTVLLGVIVGGVAVLVVTTIYSAMRGIGK